MTATPPKKRLRLTLTIDGHNPEDLARVFEQAVDWVERRKDPLDAGASCISGGGWYGQVIEQEGYTPEPEWEDTLLAWHDENRRSLGDA